MNEKIDKLVSAKLEYVEELDEEDLKLLEEVKKCPEKSTFDIKASNFFNYEAALLLTSKYDSVKINFDSNQLLKFDIFNYEGRNLIPDILIDFIESMTFELDETDEYYNDAMNYGWNIDFSTQSYSLGNEISSENIFFTRTIIGDCVCYKKYDVGPDVKNIKIDLNIILLLCKLQQLSWNCVTTNGNALLKTNAKIEALITSNKIREEFYYDNIMGYGNTTYKGISYKDGCLISN